ncbi:hypothetical protein D8674_008539 [Pyrus ussuriensis x Pyrus communis]|uniref:AT-hook motif nuclear-localized protein n=1 Tax=Pyrus ussuriensis x Pyrus communis TaxID=2448454 RepID=A0A5N5HZZ1_9ROSA|nr:hypothetical protein D8674_008539 [Pyrus ussuriensis x Pyrus communis]
MTKLRVALPHRRRPGFIFHPLRPLSFHLLPKKEGGGLLDPATGRFLLLWVRELFANTAGGDFTSRVVNVSTWEVKFPLFTHPQLQKFFRVPEYPILSGIFRGLDLVGCMKKLTKGYIKIVGMQDVTSKIFSISQKGRGVCVLSANGAVSNVTIRQPGSSGGILTYEGRFELLSLSGSFTVTETGGVKGRTGGLNVSLAGPDGCVICGGIAGVLTAARPIQIVVGSFMPNGYKAHKIRKHYREHTIGSPISSAPNTVTAATAISQAQPKTETRLNSASPSPAQSHGGDADESMIQMHNTNVMSTNASWNGASVPGVSVTGA